MEVSDHFLVLNSADSSSNVQAQASLLSVGSVLDEKLRRNAQTCTHTHNHIYTSLQSDGEARRRASGNREAVRKYREKKKAHTAYLEEEVRKLRALNEQMVKKVERQVVLEAEVMRLRGLLLKLRDKIIDSEGSGSGFPFQKHCDSATLFKQSSGCGKNKMMFSLQHYCQPQPATADCVNHMGSDEQKSKLHSLLSSSSHAHYTKE